jgi:hypothetical protein
MGNNPISMIDPTGGWSAAEAWDQGFDNAADAAFYHSFDGNHFDRDFENYENKMSNYQSYSDDLHEYWDEKDKYDKEMKDKTGKSEPSFDGKKKKYPNQPTKPERSFAEGLTDSYPFHQAVRDGMQAFADDPFEATWDGVTETAGALADLTNYYVGMASTLVGMTNNPYANQFNNFNNLSDYDKGKFYGGLTSQVFAAIALVKLSGITKIPGMKNGGYGPLGMDGVKLGSYNLDLMYSNPNSKGVTIFSLKQPKPSGNVLRLDYGKYDKIEGMGFHLHTRGIMFGIDMGKTSTQRSIIPPFKVLGK